MGLSSPFGGDFAVAATRNPCYQATSRPQLRHRELHTPRAGSVPLCAQLPRTAATGRPAPRRRPAFSAPSATATPSKRQAVKGRREGGRPPEVSARQCRAAQRALTTPYGPATRGRTHMSEHVDWRFDEYRKRSSGSVLRAWPRPDVRRWRPRRGSKHQAKAQGRPFHPGATGERQTGRVKNLNLRLMSRYGELRRWEAAAGRKDWPLGSGRRWLRSPLSREEHRRPRGTGGTHPGRISCVRNAVTPVGVRAIMSGKPTARKAQSPGGNLMTEKRNAGSRKTTGNRDMMAGPFSRPFRITGRIRDVGARTRKRADAVR